MITRRNLLSLAPVFLAAPAIIRVADLMPIKAFAAEPQLTDEMIERYTDEILIRYDWAFKVFKGPFEIVPLSTNPTT